MSTVSDMSSNGKTDKVLRAILKHLDVMDAKLSRLDPISDKVTALEVDTGGAGCPSRYARHGSRAHRSRARCTGHADDDDNHGGDFVPTVHKPEFLKYDGTNDPLPWLN
jgi:hypothetical protein